MGKAFRHAGGQVLMISWQQQAQDKGKDHSGEEHVAHVPDVELRGHIDGQAERKRRQPGKAADELQGGNGQIAVEKHNRPVGEKEEQNGRELLTIAMDGFVFQMGKIPVLIRHQAPGAHQHLQGHKDHAAFALQRNQAAEHLEQQTKQGGDGDARQALGIPQRA